MYHLHESLHVSIGPFWPRYGKAETTLQLLASNVAVSKDSTRAKAVDFLIDGHGLFTN